MLSDFDSSLYINPAAFDAMPVIGIGPKTVLEILLRHTHPCKFSDEGTRFITLGDEIEISLRTGLEVPVVQVALELLQRWGWANKRAEGFEVGYRSAAGGDVFYANEALTLLGQRLLGIEIIEKRIAIAREWLKGIEEVGDARGF